ncbi:MAG: phospholipase D/Transphosphatidylase [Thermoleophilia bacterium]|nr:phospholipase D/Transphosphatidylase [Thermoleophilia bacterium]
MHDRFDIDVSAAETLRLRRRLIRVVSAFVIVQALVALAIVVRAKYAERRREAMRPPAYPSRSFEPIELERDDDRLRLYMRGAELKDDIIDAIDEAREEVLVETFIWVNDASGRELRDALGRAAKRGVRVLVLWDWLLSDRSIGDRFFPEGVEAYPFKPIHASPSAFRPRNLLRDHRKLVIIDNRVGFTGGYNFGDLYFAWRDTHVKLSGTTVLELANAFGDFWNQHAPATATRLENVPGRTWDPHVLVHRNDPSLAIFPIRGMYLEAIDRAASRIWITNAYFVPDRAFRASLVDAARRGVDVRVLLPERSNHPLTDALAHGMFEEMLVAGVRIYLYRNFMLHAKTAVIDESWVTIGTANIDRWSMLGNYEVNLEMRDPALAEQMAQVYEFDMRNSDEVHLDGWRRRPLHWKLAERILATLAPLM